MRPFVVAAALSCPFAAMATDLSGNSGAGANTTATVTMTAALTATSSLTIRGRPAGSDPFTTASGLTGTVPFTNVNISAGTATGPAGGGFFVVPGTVANEAAVALVARTTIESTVSGVTAGSVTITGASPTGADAAARWLCGATDSTSDWETSGVIVGGTPLAATGACDSWTGSTAHITQTDLALVLSQGLAAGPSVPFTITLIPGP